MAVTIGARNRTGPEGPVGPEGPPGPRGIPGEDGSLWWDGKGKPDESLGDINDYYLDTKTGDVYRKFADGWNKQGNIRGPKGEKGEQGLPGLSSVTVTHFTLKGKTTFMYNEITLTPEETGTVLEYEVPVGKYFDALSVQVSGENIGVFTIEYVPVVGPPSTIGVCRTHWEKFNEKFELERLILSQGEKLRITANNVDDYDPDTSEFNATLFGDLYGVI